MAGFFTPPAVARYTLRNVRAPACLIEGPPPGPVDRDGLLSLDMIVADGCIAGMATEGTSAGDLGPDLRGSLVWPGLVDCHAHLDKAHTWPRSANPDGTHAGALAAVGADRAANWNARDVRARMEFGLACAYAHGVVAIRTHLDSLPPQAGISFPVFRAVRDAWAGRVSIQATCLVTEDLWITDDGAPLADLTADAGGNPFYAYGDHDMLDTFAQAVRILQLDHPFGDWPRAATATPAAIMGLRDAGTFRVGAPADLVVLHARGFGEMLARPQADRVVIRSGRAIDSTPPDFALLDSVTGAP